MKDVIILGLRLALGLAFLSAVADRFGYWGHPGETAVAWGNWDNFVQYTSTLNFGIAKPYANILGVIATIAEITLGTLLIVGYKLKYTGILAGSLLLTFALMMSISTNIKSAFDYSVYTASFASFLLAMQPGYKWSIDSLLDRKKR